MFARQNALVGGSSGNQPLVEFRAGRMNMVGKMVHPDTRKGLVYLNQAEDGLIHFCWKDRVTGKVEDDLIVFPDDFEFKRVDQCKTGRVFVLKFKTSSRRLFFWMQEPKTDKDEEYCRRVNDIMNNPPSANRSGNEGGDLQYMLNNMSQQQLMQLFGGVGQMGGLSSLLGSMNTSSSRGSSGGSSSANRTSTTTNASSSDTTSTSNRVTSGSANNKNNSSGSSGGVGGGSSKKSGGTTRITLPDLQSYLSEISADGGNSGSGGGGSGNNRLSSVNVDLSTVISSSDAVNKIISDPERAKILSEFLPLIESNVTVKQQLKDTLSSPQFQQALSLFSNALQSGQLGPVVSQFKLPDEAVAAANTGDLEQFIKALEKTLSTSSAASTPTSGTATTTTTSEGATSTETGTKNDAAPAENDAKTD